MHFGFTKNSMDYIEWDGLVSYLETWTGTFKIESSLKEIDDVVRIIMYSILILQVYCH